MEFCYFENSPLECLYKKKGNVSTFVFSHILSLHSVCIFNNFPIFTQKPNNILYRQLFFPIHKGGKLIYVFFSIVKAFAI